MANFNIEIKGAEDVLGRIERVAFLVSKKDEITQILAEGTAIIRDSVKARAPLGVTGNLKASIISKPLVVKASMPAVAIAAINYKIGPHVHLVEYGHRIVHGKGGKSTGRVRSHPFFWFGVKASVNSAYVHVQQKIIQLIEQGFSK